MTGFRLLTITASLGPRPCLDVNHADVEHQWACDRAAALGRLDKGLGQVATAGLPSS